MVSRNGYLGGYFFAVPGFLLSALIILIPSMMTVMYAFTDWNGVSADYNWIGFQNFIELFEDDIFWRALFNNVKWTAMFLTIPVIIGLVTSYLLLSTKFSKNIYQGIYIIPYILAPVTNAMLWLNIIFNPVSGLAGYLNDIGVNIGAPLGNTSTALYAVAAVDIWHYWGFLTVVYLAALRQTPTDQVEAAVIDGCNKWQQFRFVFYPSIKPTMKLMFIMIIIFSFMTFDYIYLLTGGGPARSTEMLSTYANSFFTSFQTGKAAAVALIMSIFGLSAATLYVHLSREEEAE